MTITVILEKHLKELNCITKHRVSKENLTYLKESAFEKRLLLVGSLPK